MANNRDRWVDVQQRQPSPAVMVLLHVPTELPPVWFGYWDGIAWFLDDGTRCEPTHWAPSPEPPKVTS